jgi:hypothetical protein
MLKKASADIIGLMLSYFLSEFCNIQIEKETASFLGEAIIESYISFMFCLWFLVFNFFR